MVAPPPSGEFTVVLTKPFSGKFAHSRTVVLHANFQLGAPTDMVEVIGEPNRPAVCRRSQLEGGSKSNEKSGDVPKYVHTKPNQIKDMY